MTYKEIIEMVKEASLASPGVNSFYYGTVDVLNADHNIEYARIILTPNQHVFTNGSVNTFSFNLTYIDRLTDTRYKPDVQSAALSTLKDIIKRFDGWSSLSDRFEDIPYTLVYNNTVNVYSDPQRMADALSGAWLSFDVEVNDDEGSCYFVEG